MSGGDGKDTFVYEFSDGNNNGMPDGAVGTFEITDLKKGETLHFHDTAGNSFTKTDLENNSTITDNGNNVKIVLETDNAGAVTIVLKGIGNGHLDSVDKLINAGYDLTFDA